MDFPPSAIIPVYDNKVYVKVLRLPKELQLNFKNDDYYTSKVKENKTTNLKPEEKSKQINPNTQNNGKNGNLNLLKPDNLENKFNSSGSLKNTPIIQTFNKENEPNVKSTDSDSNVKNNSHSPPRKDKSNTNISK